MSGTLSMGPGMQAPFVLEMKRRNLMRIEFTLRGETGVQAFDGRSGAQAAVLDRVGPQGRQAAAEHDLREIEFGLPLADTRFRRP